MIDNWKNREVFLRQLKLNIGQLNGNAPKHWGDFKAILEKVKPACICDVGCGSGVYSQLVGNIIYVGIDYSKDAVEIATNAWGHFFYELDLWELTPDFVNDFDMITFGALLDILPNANEALKFILGLNHKCIVLGRVRTTTKEDYFDKYVAYDLIETCAYYHNQYKFVETIRDNGYEYDKFGDTWLLSKLV